MSHQVQLLLRGAGVTKDLSTMSQDSLEAILEAAHRSVYLQILSKTWVPYGLKRIVVIASLFSKEDHGKFLAPNRNQDWLKWFWSS